MSIRIPLDQKGTIPTNIEETLDLSNNQSYCRVFADSFGPFRPERYFKSKYKTLFVLKESYLGSAAEESECYEGHDKAKEYVDAEWSKQPKTYQNTALMCFALINGRTYDETRDTYQDVLGCLWDNACVINANKFPCIAADDTSSTDRLIYDWALKNEALIQEELDLNRPDIVVGGHTLGHFAKDVDRKWNLFGKEVNLFYPHEIANTFDTNLGKDNYVYYNNILYINAYHPSVISESQIQLILKIRDHLEQKCFSI